MTCDAKAGVAGTTRKANTMTVPVRFPGGHKQEPKGQRCHDKPEHERDHGHCKKRKPKHCKHHHRPKHKGCH